MQLFRALFCRDAGARAVMSWPHDRREDAALRFLRSTDGAAADVLAHYTSARAVCRQHLEDLENGALIAAELRRSIAHFDGCAREVMAMAASRRSRSEEAS